MSKMLVPGWRFAWAAAMSIVASSAAVAQRWPPPPLPPEAFRLPSTLEDVRPLPPPPEALRPLSPPPEDFNPAQSPPTLAPSGERFTGGLVCAAVGDEPQCVERTLEESAQRMAVHLLEVYLDPKRALVPSQQIWMAPPRALDPQWASKILASLAQRT